LHGFGSLPIRVILYILHHQQQGDPPWLLGELPTRWIQGRKVVIGVDGA